MPRYTAHLTAQDGSGHFRRVVIVSGSEAEARAALEQREASRALSFLQPDDLARIKVDNGLSDEQLAQLLDQKQDLLDTIVRLGVTVAGGDRQQLVYARQQQPYKIDWIVEGRNPGRTPGWKRKAAK